MPQQSVPSYRVSTYTFTENPNPQPPYDILCIGNQCSETIGDSVYVQGTATVDDTDVLVLNASNNISLSDRLRTKKKTADGYYWKYYGVICKGCGTDVGRYYKSMPSFPELEAKYCYYKDRIRIEYISLSLPSIETPPSPETPPSLSSLLTDEQSQNDQSQYDQSQDIQAIDEQASEEQLESQEPTDSPTSEQMASDIFELKRFCLNLDETQNNLSNQISELKTSRQAPQNPKKSLQKDLDDLRSTFKTFESRLTAVESSVQNRLTALESALQIILENQSQSRLQVDHQHNADTSSRKSNISVEIPIKKRHRLLPPKPITDKQQQQQQNISPPPSEEPIDESNEDTTSNSKHAETRTARGTKSQPRQAELTNPSNAQEVEATRQARDEEGARAETSIVISDDGSGDDDDGEYNAEHASKRARLSKKKQKQKQQEQIYGKKKRGRPSIGASAKQELRIDRPDEDEDDDQGTVARVTRSKRSS